MCVVCVCVCVSLLLLSPGEGEGEEPEEEGDEAAMKRKPWGDSAHFCPVALKEHGVLWPGNQDTAARYTTPASHTTTVFVSVIHVHKSFMQGFEFCTFLPALRCP